MAAGSQKPGGSDPNEFKARPVKHRKAPKALGRTGTPDNQSTFRGKGKT